MRTLALILLFLGLPLAGGDLHPDREEAFWKNSGMGVEFFSRLVNNRSCGASTATTRACRQALEHLGVADAPIRTDFDQMVIQAARIPPKAMDWGRAATIFLKHFDPYARILPAEFSRLLLSGERMAPAGFGFEPIVSERGLTVFAVHPSTPAERGGLKVHDRIVAVDDLPTDRLEQALIAVPRFEAAQIRIVIERGGRRLPPVVLRAARLVLSEMPSEMITHNSGRYLKVRIRSFGQDTCLKLQHKIEDAGQIDGLILDLRQNPGGRVDEGECVARLFVGPQKIVERQPVTLAFPPFLDFAAPAPTTGITERFSWAPHHKGLSVVVLINAATLSSAEIVAAALQDRARAWIVGERSFGKGTTQILHTIAEFPKLKVMKTVSRYLRANGASVHATGVTPNFTVPFDSRDQKFRREENLPHRVVLKAGEPWRETRGDSVRDLKACADSRLTASEDPQLDYARAVLECDRDNAT